MCDVEIEHLIAFDELRSTLPGQRLMPDCLRVLKSWTALISRTTQYELDSESSILRCDVLVKSEV